MAVNTIRHDAKQSNMTFKEYGIDIIVISQLLLNLKFNFENDFLMYQLSEGKIPV